MSIWAFLFYDSLKRLFVESLFFEIVGDEMIGVKVKRLLSFSSTMKW